MVAMVFGTSLLVWQPWTGHLLSAEPAPPPALVPGTKPSAEAVEDSRYVEARKRMVEEDLRGRDITNVKVLEVMGRVPRHRFVAKDLLDVAYADQPLPIGHDQTISQPYIVALMTQAARPKPTSRALDIGTGSGYQTAVLAEVCKEVYSIEILNPLAASARNRLTALGYKNITIRVGDGYRGWPEKAPFDVIIVAAAPDHVPQPLVDQLASGGRLVIPVGNFFQDLLVIAKQKDGTTRREAVAPVRFVPMRGEAEKARDR
jgi:protein-L-isoaspartate(D-aspartate) O-methyltransferase